MITISSTTLKGGVGKSTLVYNLAGVLAKRGRRVLLLDADPQANLTQGFWGSREIDPRATIAEVWRADPLPERVTHETGFDGIRIIPGHEAAAHANMIPEADWGDRVESLSLLLRDVADDYDFALIDDPPNLHLCSHASMVAADEVIIPLQAEDPGSRGMVPVMRAARAIRERWGRPGILGQLLTMFDRRLAIHLTYEQGIRDAYGDLVFSTAIPYAAVLKEAFASRTPISHHKPRSVAAKAFASLADEIEQRLEVRRATPSAA